MANLLPFNIHLKTENHKQADVTKGVNANDGTTIADELELEANMRDLIEKDKRRKILSPVVQDISLFSMNRDLTQITILASMALGIY